jgi:hypothetical protein
MNKKTRFIFLLALGLMPGGIVNGTAQAIRSEGTCVVRQTAPSIGSWTWAEMSRIEVYVLQGDFSADEVPPMLTALKNWDDSASENGSGVRFEYKGSVAERQTCDNCLTILRGQTTVKRHGAELKAFSRKNNQVIDYAWIVIDPAIRKSEALTSILAHELGHSLGLLDCYNCPRGSTAMTHFNATLKLFQLKIADFSNGMKGPTACDVAQVKAAYEELRSSPRPAPAAEASAESAVAEEEAEEDDTPVVVP